MNCQKMQCDMLLFQTGELPDRDAQALLQHVAGCAACRAYQDELSRLLAVSRTAIPETERAPRPATMVAIRRAARRDAQPAKRIAFFLPYLRVAAYAAAVLILMGGILWFPSRWQAAGRSNRITTLASLISVATEKASESNKGSAATGKDELHALASQLMAIEGMNPDESQEGDIIPAEEPQPTDLRSHSIVGLGRRVCV